MRRIDRIAPLLAAAGLLASLALAQTPPSGPPPGMFGPVVGDTAAVSRDSLVKVLLARIAGRENAPAESVFRNIKLFRGAPAGRLLRVMNIGFGRSLGVGCIHCHDLNAFDGDEKKPKRVAREMWAMMRTINDSLLARIPDLQSQHPGINCTTCHRGQVKPALDFGGR